MYQHICLVIATLFLLSKADRRCRRYFFGSFLFMTFIAPSDTMGIVVDLIGCVVRTANTNHMTNIQFIQ